MLKMKNIDRWAPLTSAQEDEGLIELILKASNEITLVMGDFNFPGIKLESDKASGNEEKFLGCIQGLVLHSACLASY